MPSRSLAIPFFAALGMLLPLVDVAAGDPGASAADETLCADRTEGGDELAPCVETPSTTVVYSSGNIAVPIPSMGTGPGSAAPVTLHVTDTGFVTDINLRLRANHTFLSDLDIRLVAPNGSTTVLLVDEIGSTGDNFGSGATDCSGTKTVLDDAAGTELEDGTPPFAGSFRPINTLQAFNGFPVQGNWQVRIFDDAVQDSGTLFCVDLELTFEDSFRIFADGFAEPNLNAWSSIQP